MNSLTVATKTFAHYVPKWRKDSDTFCENVTSFELRWSKKVLLQALNLRPATEIISSFNSMKRLGVLLPMARRDASPLQVIPKHVQQVAVHNNFQLPVY